MSEERRSGDRRRTLALHGRNVVDVSSLTPQSVAASNPCLNCATNVQLEFCPECGQRAIDPDPTLREFLHELAEGLLHWDGKLFTTFRLLVTRPGELTREYLAGRRVRYISPLRVYLTCSLLFFFLAAVVPTGEIEARRYGASVTTRVGPVNIASSDSAAALVELDRMARDGGWLARRWGRHYGAALRNHRELAADISASLPKTMFVLVPVFALLVMLAFRQARRRFPQHLAFALHTHAFLFLALTVMLLREFTSIVAVYATIRLACVGAVAAYFVLAMRRVYGVGTGTIARSALVGVSYFLLVSGAMVVAFVLIVFLRF